MVTYKFGTITPQLISYTGGKRRVVKKRSRRSGSKKRSAAAALKSLRAKEAAAKASAEKARQAEIRKQQQKASADRAKLIKQNSILSASQKLSLNNIINKLVFDNRAKNFDINAAMRAKRDIATGNISRAWSVVVNNITGGMYTQRKINSEQRELNNKIKQFNNKWRGNNALSGSIYKIAINEKNSLNSQQQRINDKNQSLDNSKVKKFLNIKNIPRFDILGLVPLKLSSRVDAVNSINIFEIESPATFSTTGGGATIPVDLSVNVVSPLPRGGTSGASIPVSPVTPVTPRTPTSPSARKIPTSSYSADTTEVVGITRYGKLYSYLSKISSYPTTTLRTPIVTYAIVIRRNRKQIRIKSPPLSLNNAKDLLAFILDNSLARSGKLVRIGNKRTVMRIVKGIKGYYVKNKRKFRLSYVKGGMVIVLVEKKRYIGDTRGEVRQLRSARKKKVVKRKTVKKKIKKKVKRKPVKKKVVRKKKVKRKQIKRKKKKK